MVNSKKNVQVQVQDIYLELWHIDTFEGGTGSRGSFLKDVAREFRTQTNVKVVVKTQTKLSAEQLFGQGIYPDMISYGNGIQLPYANLQEFFIGASGGGESRGYAKVWCCGGYVLISRKDAKIDGVIVGVQENVIPLLAYHLSGLKMQIFDQVDSKNAIYSFYQHKNCALLGTQRDLYRLQNKGLDLNIEPLYGYNDLFQYISVITENDDRIRYCQAFIDYLTDEKRASQLYKIGMISYDMSNVVKYDAPLDIYNGGQWSYITEPLLPPESVKILNEKAKNYQENSESIKNALKRLK